MRTRRSSGPQLTSTFGAQKIMEYKGQVSAKDYINAQWLHLRPRKLFLYAGIVISILIGIGLVSTVVDAITGEEMDLILWVIWGAFLYAGIWFFAINPVRWKKQYKQQKLLHEPFEFVFLDNRIQSKSKIGEGLLDWDVFLKWQEGKNTFLLYQSDILMHIIPERFIKTTEQIDEFRNILTIKVGKPCK